MKTTRKTVIAIAVATVLTATAAAVVAHPGGDAPGGGPGAGYGQMQGGHGMMGRHGHMMGGPRAMLGGAQGMMFGDHAAYAEQRLENFKAQLDITPEQEEAWSTFAATVRGQAEAMKARHQAMAGGGKGFGFTEHFAQMQAGAAQMEAVAAAAQELYAALTPDQQTRADSLTTGGCWR